MTKAIQGTEHSFKMGESFQWGAGGAPWESAQTPYICTACGQSFVHYYHTTPNIFEAMEQAGIDPNFCNHMDAFKASITKTKMNTEALYVPITLVLLRSEVMVIIQALKRWTDIEDRKGYSNSSYVALADKIFNAVREQFVAFENQNEHKQTNT